MQDWKTHVEEYKSHDLNSAVFYTNKLCRLDTREDKGGIIPCRVA